MAQIECLGVGSNVYGMGVVDCETISSIFGLYKYMNSPSSLPNRDLFLPLGYVYYLKLDMEITNF